MGLRVSGFRALGFWVLGFRDCGEGSVDVGLKTSIEAKTKHQNTGTPCFES